MKNYLLERIYSYMDIKKRRDMAKIILVDDEQEILTPLEEMLTSEGFKVRSFLNPHKALDYLKSQTVD